MQLKDLNQKAILPLDVKFGVKQYMNTADSLKKQADYAKMTGDIENAYVFAVRFCTIITDLRKHPGLTTYLRTDVNKRLYEAAYSDLKKYLTMSEELKAQLIARQPPQQPVTGAPLRQVELKQIIKTPEVIGAQRVFDYLGWQKKGPNILVIDVRSRAEFVEAHFKGYSLVNIDPSLLVDGVTGIQLEQQLTAFHRENFSKRQEFDFIVMMDHDSQNRESNKALQNLYAAMVDFEVVKVPQKTPAVMIGGWIEWRRLCQTAAIRVDRIGFGDVDGVVPMSDKPTIKQSSMINTSTSDYLQSGVLGGQTLATTMSAMELGYTPPLASPSSHGKFDEPFYNFAVNKKPSGSPQPTGQPEELYPQNPSYAPLQIAPLPTAPPVPEKDIELPRKEIKRRAQSPPPAFGNDAASTMTYHQYDVSDFQNNAGGGRGMCGLKNLGNTCYMNSIVQCLVATRPLVAMFIDGSYRRQINSSNPLSSKGKLANAFAQLVQSIQREEHALSPTAFREVLCIVTPQFKGSEQHDSQEFLAFLLDCLHEDINQGIKVRGGAGYNLKVFPKWFQQIDDDRDDDVFPEQIGSMRAWTKYISRNDSPIVDLFQGQLKSQLQCSVCQKTSSTYNPFMYLSLPIPQNGGPVRLADCLNEFCKEEVLDEGDSWKCPNCKVYRKATKRLTIVKLPQILLVHLKRFSSQGIFRDKINTFVDFPIRGLDLFPYLSPSLKEGLVSYYSKADTQTSQASPIQKYDLYAISNHYGGINGGHYTSYVRNPTRKAWFHFDDTHVTQIVSMSDTQAEAQKIKTTSAYSLFYVSWGFNQPTLAKK